MFAGLLYRAPAAVAALLVLAGAQALSAPPPAPVPASTSCDAALIKSIHAAQLQVDSLRPDKAGQARVFAADGSEFTAGQANWMKGELHAIELACAQDNAAAATQYLSEIQALLRAHAPK